MKNTFPNQADISISIDGVVAEDNTYLFEIEQSIFNLSASAKIELRDSSNLAMTSDVSEGSKLSTIIKSDTPIFTGSLELDFIINKTSDKILSNYFKEPPITFELLPEFIYLELDVEISKIFKGISKKDIISESISKVESSIEFSSILSGIQETYNIRANELSPFEIIRLVLKSSNLLVCNLYNSKFYCLDVSNIESSGFSFAPKNIETTEIFSSEQYLSYSNLEIIKGYDALLEYSDGRDATNITSFDFINKEISNIKSESTSENFGNTQNVFHIKHSDNYESGIIDSDRLDAWALNRNRNIFKLDDLNIIISVSGNVTYFDILGKSIYIEVPSATEHTSEKTDTVLSGDYIVIGIFHIFFERKYIANLKCKKI